MLRGPRRCSSVRSGNLLLAGIYPPPPRSIGIMLSERNCENNLLQSVACGQNLENKMVATWLRRRSQRACLDDDRLLKLCDGKVRRHNAGVTSGRTSESPRRLEAVGEKETPCWAGGGAGGYGVLRLRKPIRFANLFAALRMTVLLETSDRRSRNQSQRQRAGAPALHEPFLGAAFYKWEAPGAGCQQGSEEDYGVDAGAAFGRPVDVFQVQPESEFV